MMFKRTALVLALTIGVIGCVPLAKVIGGSSVAEVVPVTAVEATRALIYAHLAFDGVSVAVTATANSGVIDGAKAATVKCWYNKAGAILKTADAAERALNVQGVMNAIASAQDAIVQAKQPTAACA